MRDRSALNASAFARAIVVMGKVPRAGRVKTRLARRLSSDAAARLYEAFLFDTFALVDRAYALAGRGFDRVFACAVESESEIGTAERLLPEGWRFITQRGVDLGERIECARIDAAARDVAVIGSDSPTLAPERLVDAFDELARANKEPAACPAAVLGPTTDGGYYLIALRGEAPQLFHDVPWSTKSVLETTRRNALRAGIRLVELPIGYDIDEIGDLSRALADASAAGSLAVRTRLAIGDALALLERGL